MLQVPFPGSERLSAAAAAYASSQPGRSYHEDLVAAHRAAGLALDSPHRRLHITPAVFCMCDARCQCMSCLHLTWPETLTLHDVM